MTADDIDRCGVIWAHTGEEDPFLYECIWHDNQYLLGGSIDQQLWVDQEFLRKMIKKIKFKYPHDFRLYARAYLYKFLASNIGRWIWTRKNRFANWGKHVVLSVVAPRKESSITNPS